MGHGKYVGRVGALAVGLGVGMATAAVLSGTANAAPSESASAPSDSSVGASAKTPARTSAGHAADKGSAISAVRSRPSASGAPQAGPQAARRGGVAAAAVPGPQATVTAPNQSVNLLKNPGAEFGIPSLTGYTAVTVPGWEVTGTPTVIQYDTVRRFPSPLGSPGPILPLLGFPQYGNQTLLTPAGSGKQFFGGGPVADSSLTQRVDLTPAQAEIDLGGITFTLGASLGGFFIDPSRTQVAVTFLDAGGNSLGTSSLQTVTALNRRFVTGFIQRDITGTIPVGTRTAQVVVSFDDKNPVLGNYNNAYADNVSFTIGADMPAPGDPTPPPSNIGALDHVFMVYMENKGFTNIVGSPNAPYINGLYNTYGVATDYYALTHPSLPNYLAVLGGSDFHINWDCDTNCVDATNLTNTVTDAGKTWAAYEQNGGGYSQAGELSFLSFSNIYNDPGLVNSHILPLTQMATDLADPATAPNYAWFAADEDNNMEGPVDNLIGVLRFVITQFTNQQYNVKAGDNYLAETIPMIMSSATWNDPNEKSAIFLTWDEDNNNLSLGFDNQGNHVVMIVIPSPGAVAAGMRAGHFEVTDHLNHYSLLRTIDDALGLPPLTQNDRYATPMNGFWS
jgi:hypothetical protein